MWQDRTRDCVVLSETDDLCRQARDKCITITKTDRCDVCFADGEESVDGHAGGDDDSDVLAGHSSHDHGGGNDAGGGGGGGGGSGGGGSVVAPQLVSRDDVRQGHAGTMRTRHVYSYRPCPVLSA